MLFGQLGTESQQQLLITSFDQRGDQLGNAKETDLLAGQASCHSQRRGQVSLPGTTRADQNEILPFLQVLTFHQL